MAKRSLPARIAVVLAAFVLVVAACGDDDDASDDTTTTEAEADAEESDDEAMDDEATEDPSDETTEETEVSAVLEGELVGLFGVAPGACDAAGVPSGSYFRMLQPGGDPQAGPFIENADSTCADTTYLPLSPGSDGGLLTGQFQPAPDPAFDDTGNGLANAIFEPAPFFAVDFAVATSDPDAQTGAAVSAPSITAEGTQLTGDLAAVGAYYGGEVFNQGSPKPDGSQPGATAGPAGQIDSGTGEYTLEWTSQISGGAFDGFTGVWHLEGQFEAE